MTPIPPAWRIPPSDYTHQHEAVANVMGRLNRLRCRIAAGEHVQLAELAIAERAVAAAWRRARAALPANHKENAR